MYTLPKMVLAHDVPDVDEVPVVVKGAAGHAVTHEPVILYLLVESQVNSFFLKQKI